MGTGFSGIQSLVGNANTDSFVLTTGTLAGTVDGAGGTNTLTGANVANTFTVTGSNSGTATGLGTGFSNVQSLVGNANTDSFVLTTGTLAGTVDGAGGTNTLTGANVANTFTVTGSNSGTATGTGGFSNVQSLVGGSSTNSFVLNAGTLAGSVNGNGGTSTLTGDNVANTFTGDGLELGHGDGAGHRDSGIQSLVGNANTDSSCSLAARSRAR